MNLTTLQATTDAIISLRKVVLTSGKPVHRKAYPLSDYVSRAHELLKGVDHGHLARFRAPYDELMQAIQQLLNTGSAKLNAAPSFYQPKFLTALNRYQKRMLYELRAGNTEPDSTPSS